MRSLRYATRSLRRTPIFTVAAVTMLALAVGAGTTVSSLLYGLVWRSVPVRDADALVQIATRDSAGRDGDLTWRQYRELDRAQHAFSSVIAWIAQGVFAVETDNGQMVRSAVTAVSGNYFDELGAVPVVGRLIDRRDVDVERGTALSVVVIGHAFWQQYFGGDPAVIGRTLKAEGVELTVIGVAPPGFRGLTITSAADLTIPITLVPRLAGADLVADLFEDTTRWVGVTGRLRIGESLDSARAQLEALWPAVRDAAMPAGLSGGLRDAYSAVAIDVRSGRTGVERILRARYTQPLYVLLAVACLVLAVAAVNLCSLTLARMEARRFELHVRMALGASRLRLLLELAAEGSLVGALGGVAGLFVADIASRAIAAWLLRDYIVATSLEVSPSGTISAIAAGIGLLVGILTTVIAALLVAGRDAASVRASGRTASRSWRVGRALVATQIAISVVLVTSTALLARNLQSIAFARSGMTEETVLVGHPYQRVGAYRDLDPAPYYQQVLGQISAVPGVRAAAFSTFQPEGGVLRIEPVAPAEQPAGLQDVGAEAAQVSPGFFETMGIRLLQGRDFTFEDIAGRPRVAVMSRRLAQRLFGADRGVGERIRVSLRPEWRDVQVVGIVEDARVFDVRGGNVDIVYVPSLQAGASAHYKTLVVRAPASTVHDLRRTVESFGVEVMPRVETLDYWRGRTILQERIMALVSGYFGLVGLGIAAIGVYGLLAYVLSLRRKEIGVRMALGADAVRIGRAVVGDGCKVAVVGIAAGLLVAIPAAALLERVLVRVTAHDPLAIGSACGIVFGASFVASLAPALRAARVQPLDELRRD